MSFPNLPKGHYWRVRSGDSTFGPRVTVRIKRFGFTVASDESLLISHWDKSVEDLLEMTARAAYREFLSKRNRPTERQERLKHARRYETFLNDHAH